MVVVKTNSPSRIFQSEYPSPIGKITLFSDGLALLGVYFESEDIPFGDGKNAMTPLNGLPVFIETKRWLDLYFQGKDPDFLPPLKIDGTPFRKKVSRIMLTIPFGKTMTYGDIAKRIARETGQKIVSAQAVGGAVGHNPFSILVPCHRVVGANGNLTGYGGGLDKKIFLLENEGIDLAKEGFFLPKSKPTKPLQPR